MSRGEAISHIVQFDDCRGALSAARRASIADLNLTGPDRVASLATSSSTIDQTTRILRSTRSLGQMYGHRCTNVPIRVACSMDLLEGGSAPPVPRDESVWAINKSLEQNGGPIRCRACFFCLSAFCPSYRAFRRRLHPRGGRFFRDLRALGRIPLRQRIR